MMLQCGHSANATLRTPEGDVPCCVICYGGANVGDKAITPAEEPQLEGRTAICHYQYGDKGKHGHTPSHTDLPFFEHRPTAEFDFYYCGCWGWD